MTEVRRLRAVGAVLALATVVVSAPLWAEPAKDPFKPFREGSTHPAPAAKSDDQLTDALASSKFAANPVVTYRTQQGETLFALQVKPKLDPAPARPRDVAILIDTSASQSGGPLAVAQKLTEAIAAASSAEDRLAIWTVNVQSKQLTGGFKSAAELQDTFKALRQEYPSGAANLKDAMDKVIAGFAQKEGRQRVVVFLGDGMSILHPLTSEERAGLCARMVEKEITFFPVPLGVQPDPQNLHGFASGTGGAPVRLVAGAPLADTVKLLQAAMAVPVVYVDRFELQPEAPEVLPTRLPPVRADSPTLVVGRLNGGHTLGYTLEGTVAGRKVRLQQSEAVPEPEVDNFFLVSMVSQWRDAKDQPALIRADRALASAQEQNQLARAEILAKAEWALSDDKLDAALDLFEKARKLDPHDLEANAGLDVVKRLREGKLTKDQLRDELRAHDNDTVVRIARLDKNSNRTKISRERIVALANADDARPDGPVAPPEAPDSLLKDAKQRQEVEKQRTTQIVDEAIRQARRALRSDPDRSHEELKRTLDAVRNNPDLPDNVRDELSQRLTRALRNVDVEGVRIKHDLEEQMKSLARARDRLGAAAAALALENEIAARMQAIRDYINQGREELASAQALRLHEDLLKQGVDTPASVTAAYVSGQFGNNLREVREIYRIRQDRFMQTLLQVEKSAIPFPDEPPIRFPPAATWKALSALRKDRYESSGMGEDLSQRSRQLQELLNTPVREFKGFDDPKTTLQEALDFLSAQYGLSFDVNENAFKAAQVQDVMTTPIAEKPIPKMYNVSPITILLKVLSRVPGDATYMIRRDHVEITTAKFQVAEKVVRAYPVADLVTPIPNAINQQAAMQSLTLFGNLSGPIGGVGALGVGGLGALGGGLGALGAVGALGALGGGLGALGALGGGGLGALGGGALGALGGGIGALGGGIQIQGGLGAIGAIGGAGNLGGIGAAGGTNLGVAGGQLGQYGNLGGQFGLQGGDTSNLLVALIKQTIGSPRDWAPPRGVNLIGAQAAPGGGPGNIPVDDPNADPLGNDVAYYKPALALVVKGTSRIHNRPGSTAPVAPEGAPVVMRDDPRPGHVVVDARHPGKGKVAGAGDHDGDKDPKNRRLAARLVDKDPRVVWDEALAKGVDDPGLIVASVDYMVQAGRFDHAAEFLKANLRQGIVVRPWVYESLALALRESKASPEEIERAEVSVASLEPLDAQGYLHAAQAMKELKRYDHAVAFCKQAALLEPNAPQAYAQALVCAEVAKDSAAMEWAAGNLLRRDWPTDNKELQTSAEAKLDSLAKSLKEGNRKADAERLLASVKAVRERDLVIRLSWQGEADLDLKVSEPSGSTCSCLNRQTVGGGTLLGDTLSDMTSETYVAAQAYAGEYKVKVDTVWGTPLAGKAKLEVIEHQGTPRQVVRLYTLDVKRAEPTIIKLEEGRRTSLAAVPPPAAQRAEKKAVVQRADHIFDELRAAAEPDAGGYGGGLSGGVVSPGRAIESRPPASATPRSAGDHLLYQNKVAPFVGNTSDVTAQAVMSGDGRYVRFSLSPVYNTLNRTQAAPVVTSPLIPGGGAQP